MTVQGDRQWSSGLMFLAAAIGSAVGIANIWKFTYVAGGNGGGAFVLIYVIALFCIALPALVAELMIGRRGGRSVVGTMAVLREREGIGRGWKAYGVMAVTTVFIALSFYCVVAGWTIDYFRVAVSGAFRGMDATSSGAALAAMHASPMRMIVFQTLFIGLTVWIVAAGIHAGLERALKLLTPGLFLILLIMLGYAMIAGDAAAGLTFLFRPNWAELTPAVVLFAVGQAFFSLGVGVGVIMTIGAYMDRNIPIVPSGIVIAAADGAVALIAAMVMFPIVFAHGLSPAQGPGLIFATLPVAFGQMNGGAILGPMFFLLMAFAALSSSITLLESIIATLEDYTGLTRIPLTLITGLALWLVGLGTVFSFNLWADFHPLGFIAALDGRTLYDLKGLAVANVLMPAGGILLAVLAGWIIARRSSAEELGMRRELAYRGWRLLVRWVMPSVVILVFAVNLLA